MAFLLAAIPAMFMSAVGGAALTGVAVYSATSTVASSPAIQMANPLLTPGMQPIFVPSLPPPSLVEQISTLAAQNEVAVIAGIVGLAAIVIIGGITYYYYLPPKNENESDEAYKKRLSELKPMELTSDMLTALTADNGFATIHQYIGVFSVVKDDAVDEFNLAAESLNTEKPKVYIFTNGYLTVFDKPESYNANEKTIIENPQANIAFTSSLYSGIRKIESLTVKNGEKNIELLNGINYVIGKEGYQPYIYDVGQHQTSSELPKNLREHYLKCSVKENGENVPGKTKCLGFAISSSKKNEEIILYNQNHEEMDKMYQAVINSVQYESNVMRNIEFKKEIWNENKSTIESKPEVQQLIQEVSSTPEPAKKISYFRDMYNAVVKSIGSNPKLKEDLELPKQLFEELNGSTQAPTQVDITQPVGAWVMVFGEGAFGMGLAIKNDSKLRRRYVAVKGNKLYYYSDSKGPVQFFDNMNDNTKVALVDSETSIGIKIDKLQVEGKNPVVTSATERYNVKSVTPLINCDYTSIKSTRKMITITFDNGKTKNFYGTETNDGIAHLSRYLMQATSPSRGGMNIRTLRKRKCSNRRRPTTKGRRVIRRYRTIKRRRTRR
jgi:hypothetical protein